MTDSPLMRQGTSADFTPRKRGCDLQENDLLMFFGGPHRIATLDPYDGCLVESGTLPVGTRIARASDGWSMTICPDSFYEVG